MGFFLKMRPLEPDSDVPSLPTMTLQGTNIFLKMEIHHDP